MEWTTLKGELTLENKSPFPVVQGLAGRTSGSHAVTHEATVLSSFCVDSGQHSGKTSDKKTYISEKK